MAEVRDAHPADAEEIASVHVASWKAAYRGLLPDGYLDALAPGDRLPWWRQRLADGPPPRGCILVVEDDGGVRGLSATVPDEETPTPAPSCRRYTCTRRCGAGVTAGP